MCEYLNLNYDILAEHNHKGLNFGRFHRFLKGIITIAAKERGTNNIFVLTSITTGYAWNSVPIDGTDILRSISATGREIHFLINIDINYLPNIIQNNTQSVLEYLKLVGSSYHFSSSFI